MIRYTIRNKVVLALLATVTACGGSDISLADPPTVLQVSVTLSTSSLTLPLGDALKVSATVLESDGKTIAPHGVVWTSSAASVATVASDGTITAMGIGVATIHATSTDNPAAFASATVTVVPAHVAVQDWAAVGPWVTFQGDIAHTGYVPVIADPAVFTPLWTRTIGTGAGMAAVEGNGRVFAAAIGYGGPGTVTAFDIATGSMAWTKSLGANTENMPPAYSDGQVVVPTSDISAGSSVHSYDEATGNVSFTAPYSASGTRSQAPVIIGSTMLHSCGYAMCARSTASGTQLWRLLLTNTEMSGWTPAVSNGVAYAYFGHLPRKVSAVDVVTGALLYEIPDPFTAADQFYDNGYGNPPPVIDNNRLFATDDGRLVAFDLTKRSRAWQVAGAYNAAVAVANGVVYSYGRSSRRVDARSPEDGSLLWSWTAPEGNIGGSLIVTKNLLFVGTSITATTQGTFAVDLNTHQTVWSYPAGLQLSIGASGTLYISQGSGQLTAIRLKQ